MHPRQQLTHHPMVGYFLRMGLSVWTQDSRSPNNDLNLVHEQALLDVAAGQVFLRDLGFAQAVTFGHSGGGPLFAYYIEQAALPPESRIDATPAGRPVALAGAQMPVPDGAVFLAPPPGQGRVLLHPLAAAAGRFGDVIASGVQTLAIFQRLSVLAAEADWAVIAGTRLLDVQFPRPVRPDSTLSGGVRVDSVEFDPDRRRALVVKAGWLHDGGGRVLEIRSEALVRCRPEPGRPSPAVSGSAR